MEILNRSLVAGLLVPALVIPLAKEAQAGGFQITELCARCQGYRNAGAAAWSREPATVYFNPAGISFLPFTEEKKNLTDLSLHFISGKFDFSDEDSRKAIEVTGPLPGQFDSPGGPAEGFRNNDGGEDAPVPNFYYARKLDDVVGFGLAINIPYGLVTKYSDNWVGRYSSTKSDLKTVNINPAFSFKLHEKFSFGFGINMTYGKVELKNALDLGTILTAQFGSGLGNVLFPGLTPSSPEFDGRVRLSGEDWGFGWNLGGVLNLNDGKTRLGAAYRSKVKLRFSGHLRTRFPERLQGALGSRSKLDARANLNLPATVNLGISHDVTPKWTLLAGATWTEWQDFDEINVEVELEDGSEASVVEPQNWVNTWRVQIGTEYRPNSRWAFRVGGEWDESPQRNKFRNTRVPDEDRLWLALGMSYMPSDDLSVDFAYSHIFVDDYDIDEQEGFTEQAPAVLGLNLPSLEGVGNTTVGEYEAHANVFTLGVRWRF